MTDTPLHIEQLVRGKLMARSGEDRFVMGTRMFDAAREMILASLPPDLPPRELQRRLFERIYGQPPPWRIEPSAQPGAARS